MIVIWLGGGPPAPGHVRHEARASEDTRSAFKPIQTNVPGIEISELMPRLAKLADKYTILRSVSIGREDWGHGGDMYWMTGNPRRTAGTPKYPTFGNVVAKVKPAPAAVPSFVALGGVRRLYREYRRQLPGACLRPADTQYRQSARPGARHAVAGPARPVRIRQGGGAAQVGGPAASPTRCRGPAHCRAGPIPAKGVRHDPLAPVARGPRPDEGADQIGRALPQCQSPNRGKAAAR